MHQPYTCREAYGSMSKHCTKGTPRRRHCWTNCTRAHSICCCGSSAFYQDCASATLTQTVEQALADGIRTPHELQISCHAGQPRPSLSKEDSNDIPANDKCHLAAQCNASVMHTELLQV